MVNLPLEGVKILDLSRVLAGPFCSLILSDLGASVIKVEDPTNGDETRRYGPFVDNMSTYFASVNRNKTSVKINLKDPKDMENLYDLVKNSDIVIHNFTPETERNLGVEFERLRKINDRIIYISISGYGRDGPYGGLPAYDIVIQAESGLMSVTGCDENNLTRVGNSTADIYAGYQCAIAALSYLFTLEKNARIAVNIDISLLESTLYSMTYLIPFYSAVNESPKAMGISHPGIVPYQKFKTSDHDIIIAVANDRQWAKLVKILKLESIDGIEKLSTNKERLKNREKVTEIVQSAIIDKKYIDLIKVLRSNDIVAGGINKIEEVLNDPQVKHRKSIIERNIGEKKFLFASFPIFVNGRRLPFYRKDPPF
jgi:CoA:oxalate CoA-transferase